MVLFGTLLSHRGGKSIELFRSRIYFPSLNSASFLCENVGGGVVVGTYRPSFYALIRILAQFSVPHSTLLRFIPVSTCIVGWHGIALL